MSRPASTSSRPFGPPSQPSGLEKAGPKPIHAPPMRTCVGCRVVRPQAELLRTRMEAGRVRAAASVSGGRSAYVCPTRACVDLAVRKGGFRRSYRGNAVADTDTLWAALASALVPSGMHASGRNA